MSWFRLHIALIGTLLSLSSFANDKLDLSLHVVDERTNEPLPMATVLVNYVQGFVTDEFGTVRIPAQKGTTFLQISYVGYIRIDTLISANQSQALTFQMKLLQLGTAEIIGDLDPFNRMPNVSVDNFTIYAGKKADIIRPSNISVSGANSTARQIFAQVAGLNIFESNDGGLQLSIGGRGLNPNRTANFNTRQNGYDISADPLGYPESYYAPPMQAVEKIELIRGAASLQFGPQFGGMLNFDLIDPSKRKIGVISEQSVASFGLFSSFNAVGGTIKKTNYLAYYQRKTGDGWRANSSFEANNMHFSVGRNISGNGQVNLEWTYYDYVAQQAGGLTDVQFERDPSQSIRERNWFKVRWNLLAMPYEQNLNQRTRIQIKPFMLIASRDALGFLGRISRVDPMQERDLISGTFNNWGVEGRIRHNYMIGSELATLVIGGRYFDGNTQSIQGMANAERGPDFTFGSSDAFNGSDYKFNNRNTAFFAEQVFRFKDKWTVTPGLRYENIFTSSDGNYTEVLRDGAGNILPSYPRTYFESDTRSRNILLAGIGVARKFKNRREVYVNVSKNYRGINFSDIRIVNPNQVVDPNIKDERGYTADLGFRGVISDWMSLDASAFFLAYKDKIGNSLESVFVSPALGNQLAQVRKNISNAYTAGIEFTSEIDLLPALGRKSKNQVRWFTNVAHIRSKYIAPEDPSIDGNAVEYVPEWNVKTGLNIKWKSFSFSYQFSLITEQFTDASNAPEGSDPNAVVGAIPAYSIQDFNFGYKRAKWSINAGVDNFLDTSYFTRRASGYPGPGIIPADPRNLWVSLKLDIW
ncbi:MAG: Fe(3+) dicitrate transport protein [Flavobacteriales bacterium]